MGVFIFILTLISIGGLSFLFYTFNSPAYKGMVGEAKIHNLLIQLPEEYYILDDIILPTGKSTSQIDHIVVSRYGVFAIETKNYRGKIYGNDDQEKWKQIILTDVTYSKKWWKTYTYVTKNYMYNPVKQSLTHMYVIRRLLKEWPSLKVISIVVFAGNADLSGVRTNHHVLYDNELLPTILSYRNIYLSDEDVKKIFEKLSWSNLHETVDNKTHVYNVKVAQAKKEAKIAAGICPNCGGNLVKRHGKYGNFIGCSNYPKCRYILK